MKEIRWSAEKNKEVKKTRNITFEQLLNSRFIGIAKHLKRPHQQLMLFEFKRYIWVVSYKEEEQCYFLKTAFPNRKYTRKYLGGKEDEKD